MNEQELAELFTVILKQHFAEFLPKQMVIGKAKNITDNTCDVEVKGEADLQDVLLHSVDDKLSSYCLIKPKENSYVVVGKISAGKDDYVVLKCSEIESVETKIDDVIYSINKNGISIKKGNDSLHNIMNDLFSACKTTTVICNAQGLPSSPPINATVFEAIEKRLNQLIV